VTICNNIVNRPHNITFIENLLDLCTDQIAHSIAASSVPLHCPKRNCIIIGTYLNTKKKTRYLSLSHLNISTKPLNHLSNQRNLLFETPQKPFEPYRTLISEKPQAIEVKWQQTKYLCDKNGYNNL